MKSKLISPVPRALLLGMLVGMLPALAQQHRATRLGDPSTRFAPPLATPEDLRALFANEVLKPDVLFILRKAGWQGDVNDLWRAASTAAVHEVSLPKGTRIPYMSARENRRPALLQDVLWAGDEPIAAYEFMFASKGFRYRVVTPKACSNFWVENAGVEPPPFIPRPALELSKTLPPEVGLCDPIEARLTVRNTGNIPLTQVQVTDALPAGLRGGDNQDTLRFDAGRLEPGQGFEFQFNLEATASGWQANQATATCAEGATAEASAEMLVLAPMLALECGARGEAVIGRPAEVCLTVRNLGKSPERGVVVVLALPEGSQPEAATEGGAFATNRVVWEVPVLAPGAAQQFCATVISPNPGGLSLTASAHGTCAPPVETQCEARFAGVSAVLLEVVDVDDPIELGSNETYEIRVTNQGSATDTNVRLTCTIEETQEFLSGGGATAMRAEGRVITSEPLPALEPKAKAVWRVVVKALQAGDVRFAVQLTTDQLVRPVEETEATHQY